MDLYVLDSNFIAVGVVDVYESLLWVEKYNEFGSFKLRIPTGGSPANLLVEGGYLKNPSSNLLMVIETIDREFVDEAITVVTGRSTEVWFLDKILPPNTPEGTYRDEGRASHVVAKMINLVCVDGDGRSTYDIIPNLERSWLGNLGDDIEVDIKPTDVYTAIQKICEHESLGFRMVFDSDTRTFRTTIHEGNDQTDRLLFAPSLDNLYEVRNIRSIAKYKNVAYVYHKSRSDLHIVYRYGLDGIRGVDRRVLYVDASRLQDDPTDWQLTREGFEALKEHSRVNVVDGTIDPLTYTYNSSFRIGDLVLVQTDTGQEVVSRVVEHTWSRDASGFLSTPSFSPKES